MLIKEMQLGKTIEILVDREGYHYRFVSKVEGVSLNTVAVSRISAKNRNFRFEDKDNITIIYRGEDLMWKWESVKGGLAMLEGEYVHTFSSKAEGTIYNRREAFRVPIGESYLMRRIVREKTEGNAEEPEKETEEGPKETTENVIEREIPFKALLSDLSVTGAGLYTDELLDINTEITFDIPTENMGMLNCRGVIIRTADVRDKPFRHFYGCGFTVVKKGLEKYLFERQRLILRRERGNGPIKPKR